VFRKSRYLELARSSLPSGPLDDLLTDEDLLTGQIPTLGERCPRTSTSLRRDETPASEADDLLCSTQQVFPWTAGALRRPRAT
jgi:hypothetical protein